MEGRKQQIISVERMEEKDTFIATVSCEKCGEYFHFIFKAEDANIIYGYGAEEVANAYVERCAPPQCQACIGTPDHRGL